MARQGLTEGEDADADEDVEDWKPSAESVVHQFEN